jgi:hypothetical protein
VAGPQQTGQRNSGAYDLATKIKGLRITSPDVRQPDTVEGSRKLPTSPTSANINKIGKVDFSSLETVSTISLRTADIALSKIINAPLRTDGTFRLDDRACRGGRHHDQPSNDDWARISAFDVKDAHFGRNRQQMLAAPGPTCSRSSGQRRMIILGFQRRSACVVSAHLD